ncbi:hypothetical protein ANN_17486 [Periplaneta americana]|uniref:Uncharacterized protein n=1 Tax=Periplaneta americana TaxID=6978 RepID=A0ABQ8SUC4_PERAM|nr:hypothetical protein ANN_17486 [Periplaneta americana]
MASLCGDGNEAVGSLKAVINCPKTGLTPQVIANMTPLMKQVGQEITGIAMAKEAFNRKRSISCEPLKKELRKRLVWSVALYRAETWSLWRSEEKRIEAFEMWIWRRMEHVKWTDRIRNEAVLERVGEERMMLKLIRKRNRN